MNISLPVSASGPARGLAETVQWTGPAAGDAGPFYLGGGGLPPSTRLSPGPIPTRRADMARPIRLVLREGLRRHDVTVAIDGREVYRRPGAVTDGARRRQEQPETIDVLSRKPVVHVTVVATPGDLVASVDIDVEIYAIVAIDLVGTATVSFETQARAHDSPFRGP